jgi:hypothetical protein
MRSTQGHRQSALSLPAAGRSADHVGMSHADRRDRIRAIAVAGSVVLAVCTTGCGALEPRAPRVLTAGCPAVVPGTSNANEDYADMLVWDTRTYISTGAGVFPAESSPGPVRTGSEVGRVTCSLVDGPLAGINERLVNLPWPDGTATALSQGAAMYAVPGEPTKCALVARRDGNLVSYVAIDTNDNRWPPLCS